MADLFEEKAQEWDVNDMIRQLSTAVGTTILEKVNFENNMQVMDFGAGTGLISGHVAPLVEKITAVDISEAMLDKLSGKPELAGKVKTICQDITKQPLASQFDVIISAMAMHHIKDIEQLAASLAAHLKAGGKVALADLDSEDGSFHPQDTEGVFHHGFDRDNLKNILEQHGFNKIEFVTAHTVTKEERDYPIFLVTATKEA